MIALPVKTSKEDTTITPVFGKAKYIAFIDESTSETTIKENPTDNGRALSEWMVSQGATKVVFKEMGANPFLILNNNGIEVFFCEQKRPSLLEIKEAVMSQKAVKVTAENMGEYLQAGSHGGEHHHRGEGHEHGHGHGNGHGHHHHH